MNHRSSAAAVLGATASLILIAGHAQASDPSPGNSGDFRAAAASHGATAMDPDHAGIWKGATPPPGSTHGEFDSHDPIGLIAGVKVKADCSINWIDPDTGKRYCFSSGTSLVSFLTAPHSHLASASAAWSQMSAQGDH